jgi:hypothetical protein
MLTKELILEWLDSMPMAAEIGICGDCLVSNEGSLLQVGYYEYAKKGANVQ